MSKEQYRVCTNERKNKQTMVNNIITAFGEPP